MDGATIQEEEEEEEEDQIEGVRVQLILWVFWWKDLGGPMAPLFLAPAEGLVAFQAPQPITKATLIASPI